MSEGKSQAREGRRFVEVDKPGFVWRYDGATREGVTIEKRMNRSPSTSSIAKPARCQHVVRPGLQVHVVYVVSGFSELSPE